MPEAWQTCQLKGCNSLEEENPRKTWHSKRGHKKIIDQFKIDKSIAPKETQIMQKAPEKAHVPENCEISVSYVYTGKKWDQNNIVIEKIKIMLK